MALTPDLLADDLIDEIEEAEEEIEQPAKTWRIDYGSGRIRGFIDEIEAVKQFAAKAIKTARSRYLIYSDDYGCELEDLIGEDVSAAYLDAEIPRMVREALIYDDRIEDVTEISYERKGSDLFITVSIETIYGDIETEVIA